METKINTQDMPFRNRVAIVTGGAGGIGRCLVESFALEGADIAFIDVDEGNGRALEALLHKNGHEAFFYQGDIASPEILEAFVSEVADWRPHVDILVNNACLSRRGILSGCDAADFQYVQQVGVTAPYLLAKLLMERFRPGAAIVNIASTRAFQSQADTESYAAAKGGILALTHALSVSLAHRVRVNAVSPGWIDTSDWHGVPERLGGNRPIHGGMTENPTNRLEDDGITGTQEAAASLPSGLSVADLAQHAVNRIGTPPDIARAVLFLCDPRNSFVTGQNLTVDGGMTVRMIYHGEEGWTYVPCITE